MHHPGAAFLDSPRPSSKVSCVVGRKWKHEWGRSDWDFALPLTGSVISGKPRILSKLFCGNGDRVNNFLRDSCEQMCLAAVEDYRGST